MTYNIKQISKDIRYVRNKLAQLQICKMKDIYILVNLVNGIMIPLTTI